MRNKILHTVAGIALALSMQSASALLVTENIGGTAFSCDLLGAPCNWTVSVDLGAALGTPGSDVNLDGLGWDLTIETVGASWLSEAVISFQSPAGSELFSLTAGIADSFPGLGSYSSLGVLDLATALGSAPLIAGGVLTLEFFDSFDDVPGTIDAFYLDPSVLTFDISAAAVSEPAVLSLIGFGLLGMAAVRRRRRS